MSNEGLGSEQSKKVPLGRVVEVINFQKRQGANPKYLFVVLEFDRGKGKIERVPHLFSHDAMRIGKDRADRNPEDMPPWKG